jgi:hypothetical protein
MTVDVCAVVADVRCVTEAAVFFTAEVLGAEVSGALVVLDVKETTAGTASFDVSLLGSVTFREVLPVAGMIGTETVKELLADTEESAGTSLPSSSDPAPSRINTNNAAARKTTAAAVIRSGRLFSAGRAALLSSRSLFIYPLPQSQTTYLGAEIALNFRY